ncbi:MAG: hypothetical protein ACLQHF_08540 [Terracidiphilus sp.]
MRPLLYWLLLTALFAGSTRQAVCSGRGEEQKGRREANATLTSDHPAGSFKIPPETLRSAPPVVVIQVTKVANPSRTPLQIFVYLSYRSTPGQQQAEKIPVGNVGLFPADRPAAFLLRASKAFAQLKATASSATDACVLVELKPLHETDRLTSVEVTVAPPQWKAEPGN